MDSFEEVDKVGWKVLASSNDRGAKVHTIGSSIQDNEACIYQCLEFPIPKLHRICMPPQSIGRFVDIHIVVSSIECPERTYPRTPTTNDRNLLSGDIRS